MAAIQVATYDVSYLTRFPTDNAAILQLLRAATTICRIARTLGIPELADLGEILAEGAQGNLSPAEEICNLKNTISKIASIAKSLEVKSQAAIP